MNRYDTQTQEIMARSAAMLAPGQPWRPLHSTDTDTQQCYVRLRIVYLLLAFSCTTTTFSLATIIRFPPCCQATISNSAYDFLTGIALKAFAL